MIEATLLLLLGIVVILVNIAGTAYFVAQEFAYMSVDRTRWRLGPPKEMRRRRAHFR